MVNKNQRLNPRRWQVLALWWGTHALVGGSARIVFEAHLPGLIQSSKWSLSRSGLPFLLQSGTLITIFAKLVSGPITTVVSSYVVGLLSLVLCGLAVAAVGQGATVFLTWNVMRAFQSFTWPATNLLLDEYFPATEHGRAWGLMSTASRTGILVCTFFLSIFGASDENDISRNFTYVGFFLVLCGVIFAITFPRKQDAGQQKRRELSVDSSSGDDNIVGSGCQNLGGLLSCTLLEPTFFCTLFIQMAICPIAEFQSQLPLWLSEQGMAANQLSICVAAWHCGVLSSVLVAGVLFDRWNDTFKRGLVLIIPLALNSVMFHNLAGSPEVYFPFMGVLATSFFLGFTFAPTNYLSCSTWTMQYIPRQFMPTSSAVVDLAGYAGTMGLLQIQSGVSAASDSEKLLYLMKLLSYSAILCCGILATRSFLVSLQGRHTNNVKEKKE